MDLAREFGVTDSRILQIASKKLLGAQRLRTDSPGSTCKHLMLRTGGTLTIILEADVFAMGQAELRLLTLLGDVIRTYATTITESENPYGQNTD